jgi:hypothetical protein
VPLTIISKFGSRWLTKSRPTVSLSAEARIS